MTKPGPNLSVKGYMYARSSVNLDRIGCGEATVATKKRNTTPCYGMLWPGEHTQSPGHNSSYKAALLASDTLWSGEAGRIQSNHYPFYMKASEVT